MFASEGEYEDYLQTGDEIPFVQDGLRDGDYLHAWVHGRFTERPTAPGLPFHELGQTRRVTGRHVRSSKSPAAVTDRSLDRSRESVLARGSSPHEPCAEAVGGGAVGFGSRLRVNGEREPGVGVAEA